MNNLVGVIVSAIYIAAVVVTSKFMSKFGEEASLYMFCFQMYGLFICYLLIH